eukprot:GILK01009401.1.p1 GENE.GILK01009401.1~~GILK01009401.1.p1  ORF type:complete len:249 (+),score=74.06 GILK01009401.1:48-749(+)
MAEQDEEEEEQEDSDDDFKTVSSGRKSKALMSTAAPRLREHRVSKQNGAMKRGTSTEGSKRKRTDVGDDEKLSSAAKRSKSANSKKNVIRVRVNGSLNQVICDSSDDEIQEEDSDDLSSSASESDIQLSDIGAVSSDDADSDADSDDDEEDVYTQRSTKSKRKKPLERSARTVTTRQSPRKPGKSAAQPVKGSKGKKSDQTGTSSRSMRVRKPVSMKELDSDIEFSDSDPSSA